MRAMSTNKFNLRLGWTSLVFIEVLFHDLMSRGSDLNAVGAVMCNVRKPKTFRHVNIKKAKYLGS